MGTEIYQAKKDKYSPSWKKYFVPLQHRNCAYCSHRAVIWMKLLTCHFLALQFHRVSVNFPFAPWFPLVRTPNPLPLPSSVLHFTGIQSYSYMEQRKVETDVEWMTRIELPTLQLRGPCTNWLSRICFYLLTFWCLETVLWWNICTATVRLLISRDN